MSAVKRVQKLLRQSERRALDALQISNPKISERERVKRMEEGGERVRREENGVVVKGTGRAIEKALAVGRWFVANGREEEYGVAVKTGSVLVVDDVGIDEGVRERVIQEGKKVGLEGGEGEGEKEGEKEGGGGMSKSAAKKRKRAAAAEEEELPDSRTRWVNLVEITVSLK